MAEKHYSHILNGEHIDLENIPGCTSIDNENLLLPYQFYQGSAVIYDNKIHILGSNHTDDYTKHYSWNGTQWVEESTLPYNFVIGSVVVYNNKIHILGGNNNTTKHYSWDKTQWVEESTLPHNYFDAGAAVVYDNKIHILGGHISKFHYSWDGTQWIEESTLPYAFNYGSAVVYDNKIHIMGGNNSSGSDTKHYSWNGTQWTEESTLPYNFYAGSAVVYDNKIHILDGIKHYSWDGTQWINTSTLPYIFQSGAAVIYNNNIYILGSRSCPLWVSIYNELVNWTPIANYEFFNSCAIAYNNKIHILGGNFNDCCYKVHFSFNGTSWIQESTLPYDFCNGSAVIYDNKIHILGGSNNTTDTKHYSYNGISWVEESTLPYSFSCGSAVIYDNKIHILGNNINYTKHYSWDGNQWVEESTLPYSFSYGSAVIYDNKIHILGSHIGSNYTKHYSYNGISWNEESTLPYAFSNGSAIVYDNKIHIMGGNNNTTKHYSWNGNEWIQEFTLPYDFNRDATIVHSFNNIDELIYLLSDNHFYYFDCIAYTGISKVIYNNNELLNLTNDTLTSESQLPFDIIAHTKNGTPIQGTRPYYYKYNSSKSIGRIKLPISTTEETTKDFFTTIDGIPIKLRETKSGNAYYAQLVSTKTNGVESVVNIATLTAGFVDTFTIKDLKILNSRQFIITYYWATSATANSTIRARCITIKLNGSLLMGAELAISAVSSATLDVDAWLIPTMVNDSYISLRKQTTISSGAYLIGAYRAYMNNLTGALSANTTALINLTSDVDNYLPDMSLAPVKGGLFYKDASGVDSLLMINDYNSAGRVYDLSTMGSDLATVGSTNHYVLGMTKSGYIVTAKADDGIYLWYYDPSSTTNLFKKKNNHNLKEEFRSTDWINASVLTYNFHKGAAVVYDDKIHILGGSSNYTKHYSWDGTSWNEESTLPYSFSSNSAVVYNNKIHILYNNNHYSWDGNQWANESTLPYNFSGSAVVYDNKIHILGTTSNDDFNKSHYSWNGISWTQESTLPYSFSNNNSAVVYDNKIHILGGHNSSNYTKHYSWDGTQWIEESTLPYDFYLGSAVIYDNKIHIMGGFQSGFTPNPFKNHYSWNGTQWIEESTLPYNFYEGAAVIYDDKIHILNYNYDYSYDKNNKTAKILSFENDVITMSNGRRYQVTDTQFKELEQITNINTQLTTVPHYGPESSPIGNVFIYGD